ncbi:MAG: TetR/AcrR family transcriptional regulator [Cellulosilyticaceae bacterium]
MGREAQNELSKERILQAALEEFGQKGYEAASTNAMCKKHEISKGLLFHYYKSKDELFLVCVQKCFDELSGYLQTHCQEVDGTIKEVLGDYFKKRLAFFKANPLYEMIFNTATLGTPEHLGQAIRELRACLKATNEVILMRVLTKMPLRQGVEADQVTEMILGFADYLQLKHRFTGTCEIEAAQEVAKHQEALGQMVEMLFYGILEG